MMAPEALSAGSNPTSAKPPIIVIWVSNTYVYPIHLHVQTIKGLVSSVQPDKEATLAQAIATVRVFCGVPYSCLSVK